MLTDHRGVLHDDGMDHVVSCANGGCGGLDAGGLVNGYADNLDCGVRIRGPPGSTVNLHFAAMNIEGAGYGLCSQANAPAGCNCDLQTDANCIDYVGKDTSNLNSF